MKMGTVSETSNMQPPPQPAVQSHQDIYYCRLCLQVVRLHNSKFWNELKINYMERPSDRVFFSKIPGDLKKGQKGDSKNMQRFVNMSGVDIQLENRVRKSNIENLT